MESSKEILKLSQRRAEMKDALGSQLVCSIVETALEGIVRGPAPDESLCFGIRPKIHQMRLSGQHDYNALEKAFGKSLWVDNSYSHEAVDRKFKTKVIVNLPYLPFRVSVFVNPIYGPPMPKCSIQISPTEMAMLRDYKDLLELFNEKLPMLEVTSMELATDQMCLGSEEAEILFHVEMRHFFISRQQKISLVGERQANMGKKNRLNFVYHASNQDKIYERGPDEDKGDEGGWDIEDCDRVRLERTVPKYALRNLGINTLSDFIGNPRFYDLIHGRFEFRQFENSDSLPKPWEQYDTPDENGNVGMFLLEHRKHRQDRKDYVRRHMTHNEQFNPLLDAIYKAWGELEEQWRSL